MLSFAASFAILISDSNVTGTLCCRPLSQIIFLWLWYYKNCVIWYHNHIGVSVMAANGLTPIMHQDICQLHNGVRGQKVMSMTVWYNATQCNATQHTWHDMTRHDMTWLCNCWGMIYNHRWISMWFSNETNHEISHDKELVVWKGSYRFHLGFIFACSTIMNFRLIHYFACCRIT